MLFSLECLSFVIAHSTRPAWFATALYAGNLEGRGCGFGSELEGLEINVWEEGLYCNIHGMKLLYNRNGRNDTFGYK